ncbi:flagellar basal body P-ring protein FlgI [Botrimarina hoheduenensis]|uniref:Flagellar P-ring protein n=1 Tax=Botrimarina hoheduenensis TaxID=2528000 RepID=A0A5C5VY82_9BACT|nr:flagellar basal body P-ring protein FlgI [Botrimarina hoheduenensis]TWT42689.1 Flagellar P-ring protein precursor [Botrimarina hoheduenensis]
MHGIKLTALTTLLMTVLAGVAAGQNDIRLRDIARIKGQEENVLRGPGLVVGLNGTGAQNDPATMRALARSLELMGNPISQTGRFDDATQQALRNVKNAVSVIVTATVPATGARSGDKLDCHVSALSGKSLLGGRLAFASLQGPNTQDNTVYAVCEGPIQLDMAGQPMVGHVIGGCQMVRDVTTSYVSEDGWVTFVLDPNHAGFYVAMEVAEQLGTSYSEDYMRDAREDVHRYVQALDAANIRVQIPKESRRTTTSHGAEVTFIGDLMDTRIIFAEPEARVVVNTRTGSIVVDGDVAIGDVLYTHRNLTVDTQSATSFMAIADGQTTRPKLDRLLEALSNLKVSADDKIDIIRALAKAGKLHAKLIIL